MGTNVAHKLIREHLLEGEMTPSREIGLRIDQTLTQDATGTLVMLELEAMGLDRAKTEVSAQYVDHNLLQTDHKNPDDHIFLQSACERFGLWFSRPGNGVSHPVHMHRLGRPGKTLLGADSHTCAAGAIGMLAIGAGGLDVAMAIAGYPFYVKMPKIWGVRLTGKLPPWVSAKDVILELLRRHGVAGGVGRIIEYYGPGLEQLSAWDRHTICNMGAELGATTSVFPSDGETRRFLHSEGRPADWIELTADADAHYDLHDEIDLEQLEPLIAKPSSPGNVVPVREIAGLPIYQAYVGSSANPGFRDLAIPAAMVRGRRVHPHVSFDLNPASRQILENLIQEGWLGPLVHAGGRLHQTGCNGCIGMGQAPASGRNSLRTVPRNFPGRSGTREDSVFLCGPETATASALRGVITDPRDLDMEYPQIRELDRQIINATMLDPPLPPDEARRRELIKGPNIASLALLEPIADTLELVVLLKVGDNLSTDEILPAGTRVLPYRSNIPKISEFCFDMVDPTYHERALGVRDAGGHAVVGGANYGQGSSREHAALAPRYLGLALVLARSFARIHWQNLVNFGILPVSFADPADYDRIEQGDKLRVENVRERVQQGRVLTVRITGKRGEREIPVRHDLSERQVAILLAGGQINRVREEAGKKK